MAVIKGAGPTLTPTASTAAAKRKAAQRASDMLYGGPRPVTATSADPSRGTANSNATLSQPEASTHTVQIAPAPTPFLNPDDEAARLTDLSAQDSYLSGLGQQLTSLQIDTTQRLGDIERSLGQGLEANDWNTAARGLGDSSIRSQNRAQMTSQSAANSTAARDQQSNLEKYVSGEKNRVDTIVKPGINTHYDAVAAENARKIGPTFADVPNDPGAPPPDPSAPGAAPVKGGDLLAAAPTAAPGAPTAAAQPTSSPPRGVVKGGKFYHVYSNPDGSERWVYVRPAGG